MAMAPRPCRGCFAAGASPLGAANCCRLRRLLASSPSPVAARPPLLLLLLLLLPPPHPLLLPPHPLRLLLLLLLLTIIMIKRASFSHLNRREHVGIVCVMCVFALGAHTKKRIITIASNEIPHIITLCWKCILRLRPAAGTRARCAMVRCAMSTSLFTWFVADDMRGCTVWPRAAPTCLS